MKKLKQLIKGQCDTLCKIIKGLFESKYEMVDKNCHFTEIHKTVREMEKDGWKLVDTIGFDSGVYSLLFQRRKEHET